MLGDIGIGMLGQATSTPSPVPEGATATNVVAGIALGFGVVTIAMVLFFVYRDRRKTGESLERIVTSTGRLVQPVSVSPSVLPPAMREGEARIVIFGPSSVVVGAVAAYRSEAGGRNADATWSASDDEIGKQLPKNPVSNVEITPRRRGSFTLRASSGSTQVSELNVTASEASSLGQQLPYIGAGWGSIVVGLAIASITGALGLKGTISAEAVATILGALVGYVVAKGQAETSKTQTSSETQPT